MFALRHIAISLLLLCTACSDQRGVVEPSDPIEASTDAAPSPSIDEDRCRLTTALTSGPDDCPTHIDDDHDGVDDGEDLCPDTTPGVDVDASGCARSESAAHSADA